MDSGLESHRIAGRHIVPVCLLALSRRFEQASQPVVSFGETRLAYQQVTIGSDSRDRVGHRRLNGDQEIAGELLAFRPRGPRREERPVWLEIGLVARRCQQHHQSTETLAVRDD